MAEPDQQDTDRSERKQRNRDRNHSQHLALDAADDRDQAGPVERNLVRVGEQALEGGG